MTAPMPNRDAGTGEACQGGALLPRRYGRPRIGRPHLQGWDISRGAAEECVNWEQQIEVRAAEIQAEVKRMCDAAREEISRRFAFIARSAGQKRRHARRRGKK